MQNFNKIRQVLSEIQAKGQNRTQVDYRTQNAILKALMGPGNNKHAKFEQIRMISF